MSTVPVTVSRPERSLYLVLALLLAGLWLATLGDRPLFNPDEGRYAEIPREMVSGGDWVIPHLNGVAYIEKPPLQYWATAASLRVFGQGTFAARLYTALCALATLGILGFLALKLCGEAAAWRGVAVLGGMLLFVCLGTLLTLDMSLTLYMTAALAAFLLAQTAACGGATGRPGAATGRPGAATGDGAAGQVAAPGREAQGWMFAAWVATALGVLTKGLVAAVIPGGVLVLYTLLTRDLAPWRRLSPMRGLPAFLILTVPWHWLAARRLPEFLQFFFVHEHFARYLTPSANRMEPWWFFGVVLVVGSLPWTASTLRALATGWQRRVPRGGFDSGVFAWCWVIVVVGFFSLSDSKLIPYILPAFPALALLIALAPAKHLRREVFITTGVTLLIAVVFAGMAWYAPHALQPSERNDLFLRLTRPLYEVSAVLAVSAVFVLSRRRGITHAAVFLGVAWCISGLLLMRAGAVVAPIYSGASLAAALPNGAAGTPIFSVGTYDQTLPFYWRRTVTLVHYRGELDFGLSLDPAAEIADLDDFAARWQAQPAAYAVMERGMFEQLSARGLPMRAVAHTPRSVLVAR